MPWGLVTFSSPLAAEAQSHSWSRSVSPGHSASPFLGSCAQCLHKLPVAAIHITPKSAAYTTVIMSHLMRVRIWEWRSQGILAQGFSWRLQARSRLSDGLKGLASWLLEEASVPGQVSLSIGLPECSRVGLLQSEQAKQGRREEAASQK